jgi:hypothetical protein
VSLRARNRSPRTIDSYLLAARQLIDWLEETGHTARNPGHANYRNQTVAPPQPRWCPWGSGVALMVSGPQCHGTAGEWDAARRTNPTVARSKSLADTAPDRYCIEWEKVGPGSLFLIPVRTGAGLAGEQLRPPLRQAGGGRCLLLFPFAGLPQLSHLTQPTGMTSFSTVEREEAMTARPEHPQRTFSTRGAFLLFSVIMLACQGTRSLPQTHRQLAPRPSQRPPRHYQSRVSRRPLLDREEKSGLSS